MLGNVNGHLCKEDLATLPQQVLIRQPVPAVVHFLHLITDEVTAAKRLPERYADTHMRLQAYLLPMYIYKRTL